MHGINLDALSEAELIALHDAVVDRLHFLHQQKTTHALLDLAIGERVMFEDNSGQTQGWNRHPPKPQNGDGARRQWSAMECLTAVAAKGKAN